MKRMLSRTEIFQVIKCLEDVLIIKGAFEQTEKSCRYRPDWSDEKVAEKFGLKKHHIAKIRLEIFGEIETSNGSSTEGLIRNIKQLESSMNELQSETLIMQVNLRSLVSGFNALCVKLGEEDLKVRRHTKESLQQQAPLGVR